jgi:hypothetical protein
VARPARLSSHSFFFNWVHFGRVRVQTHQACWPYWRFSLVLYVESHMRQALQRLHIFAIARHICVFLPGM